MVTSQLSQLFDRLHWISLESETHGLKPGEEIIQGLLKSAKTLPCRYFYDDDGSRLFETITALPEYYLTRTEQWILENCAGAIAQLTGPCDLIELGSGSSSKTKLLLTVYDRIDPSLRYYPIDVSAGVLKDTALALLEQYDRLTVVGLPGTYEQAMKRLPHSDGKPRLMMFLGSTLGNLSGQAIEGGYSEQETFLEQVQSALSPGDFFLMGVDLQKPVEIIEAAYNDSQGVTAAFNLNILTHLNRQFLGTFQRSQFEHEAQYNADLHQIEMRLRSCQDQVVSLEALEFQFQLQADERIRTEISRKFDLDQLQQSLIDRQLQPVKVWTDPKAWFGMVLCQHT
jgi:L-histidine Nalpha-methyltransferase